MPKISVLMPAYNSENYIREAIDSILNQTYGDFEFVIVDDCSTDGTWEIIKEYAKKDKRIKPLRNKKNSGVTVSLNNGLKKCSGEIIARMDSDDISTADRFEKQIKLMDKYDVVGANIIFIDENGKRFGKRKYSNDISGVIRLESPLAHPTVMFRKELVDKYGGYDEGYSNSQDYDLWLRFYSKNARIKNIDKYLLKYRIHLHSVKNSKTKNILRNTIRIKLKANKNYNIRLGSLGWCRLACENLLLVLPERLVLKLFYLLKGIKR